MFMEKISLTKTVAIGFPILLVLYFFYLMIFNVQQTYIIDIGAEGDIDSNNVAYLQDLTKEGRLSLRLSIEDDTFRNMTGSPVYFNFTPEKKILNESKIIAELKFRGDSDLDIGAFKAYAWKPLYIRSLDKYNLARRFDGAAIYSLDNKSIYSDVDNISDWISINIPRYSFIKLYDFSPEIFVNRNITYKNAGIEINQTFLGTHSFLIYLKNTLNLTLGKQDLNAYNGSDEYSIELYDIDGNLLLKDTMEDDGISDNLKKKSPQSKTFFRDGINEGLYELRLVNIMGKNKAADSTITGLKIDTIKLITQGNILLLAPGTLYFELKRSKEIKINARQVQNISIRGALEKDVVIDNKTLNKWVPVGLGKGSYTMSIKGEVNVSGANFAFAKDSIFQPFDYEISGERGDWVIISNYNVEKDQKGWIKAKMMFMGSQLELLDNKTVVFGLKKKGKNEVTLDEFKIVH